jgi:tetratricopeptide (TPR) repeat protein
MNDQAPSDSEECLDVALLDRLWDFDDPAASEQRFLVAIAEAPAGSTRSGELITQLARSVGLQGRYDEATAMLDDLGESASLAAVVGVRVVLERGRLANSAGDPVAAKALLQEALTRARAADQEFLAIDAAHMLVNVDRDRADEWTELALHLVAAAEDPRAARWAGSLHNNSGWARHDAGDYAGALTEFEAALTAHSAHGTAEQQRVAHWAVARALRSTARRRQLVRRVRVRAAGPAAAAGPGRLTITRDGSLDRRRRARQSAQRIARTSPCAWPRSATRWTSRA